MDDSDEDESQEESEDESIPEDEEMIDDGPPMPSLKKSKPEIPKLFEN